MTKACIHYNAAHYLVSANKFSQCPADSGAEVAFAGRSNAGKSSAINALTSNSKLARTSKTPGRTQLINFFELNHPEHKLVDLPGYGYAKVPVAMKVHWQKHLDEYLQKRQCLKGVVLVMDIRHPMKEFDQMMTQWCKESQMPLHILLTKADKLSKGPAQSTMLQILKQLKPELGELVSAQVFSALKKTGVDPLKLRLDSWLLGDAAETTETTPAIQP